MVKFQTGDPVDGALVKAIAHEYSRCKFAFNLFVNTFPSKPNDLGNQSMEVNLFRYNAYALFIQHLYEYFVACIKREKRDTSDIQHLIIEEALTLEVGKILNLKRLAIDNGFAPPWENARSFYEDKCPDNFAHDFRQVRNSVAHVDLRRITGGNRITLSDFYKRYHKYVFLLFEFAEHHWSIEKMEQIDLGDVTEFNKVIYQIRE